MTDPERLSRRSTGLAAELTRAGAEEQPSDVGMQQTLLALGLSSVVLGAASSASAASAAVAGGAQLTSVATAGTLKAATAASIIKWVGVGVVVGVGFAGAATVATRPSAPPTATTRTAQLAAPIVAAAPVPKPREAPPVADTTATPGPAPSATPLAPRVSAAAPRAAEPALEVGSPLAAEVAYVDRARALLAAGQSSQGLALLERYEQQFREARLLPEVLFLQLEVNQRLARDVEARRAAQRLVDGFPKSPHAARARKLLGL